MRSGHLQPAICRTYSVTHYSSGTRTSKLIESFTQTFKVPVGHVVGINRDHNLYIPFVFYINFSIRDMLFSRDRTYLLDKYFFVF